MNMLQRKLARKYSLVSRMLVSRVYKNRFGGAVSLFHMYKVITPSINWPYQVFNNALSCVKAYKRISYV